MWCAWNIQGFTPCSSAPEWVGSLILGSATVIGVLLMAWVVCVTIWRAFRPMWGEWDIRSFARKEVREELDNAIAEARLELGLKSSTDPRQPPPPVSKSRAVKPRSL